MEATRLAPEAVRGKESGEQYLFVIVVTVLLLLNGVFNYTATDIVFYMTAILAGGSALLFLFRERYRAHLNVSGVASLGVLAWCALECLSGAWAVSSENAFLGLLGYSTAFFLFIGCKAFAGARPGGAVPLLRAAGYCGAALSLISIEMASTGLIYRLINSTFAEALGHAGLSINYGAWVEGARMESIMGLPNIFATFAAACFFVLLGVVSRETDKRPTFVSVLALVSCGAGFFLTNSRGGMLALGAALVVYVLFAERGARLAAALDGAVSAIWCGAASVIMALLMRRMPSAVLPVLCLAAVALYLARTLRGRALERLRGMNIRRAAIIAGAALLAALVYVAVGLNVHAAYTLTPDAFLNRAVSLPPGDYAVRVDALMPEDTAMSLYVESASADQASRRQSDTLGEFELLYGAEESAYAFTVPEGAAVVRFRAVAWGHEVTLNAVKVYGSDGATAANVPMRYVMLPEAIMSRLQGVWADDNVLQRFVYWRDGLKIFAQSPVYGSGANSFVVLSPGVAESYYYTRHPHNHFIQVMVETGLLGLAAMLTACAGVMYMLWKRRSDGVARMLAAAIGMILIHSFIEASLQNQLNMQLLFLLAGVAAGYCADKARAPRGAFAAGRAAVVVYVAMMVLMLGGHVITQRSVASAAVRGSEAAYSAYRLASVTDPYNADAYRAAAMSLYTRDPDPEARALVYAMAQELARGENNPKNCVIAGMFYMNTGDMATAAALYERSIALRPCDTHAWNEVLGLYYRPLLTDAAQRDPAIAALLPEMKASALRIGAMLDAYNGGASVRVEPDARLMDGVRMAGEQGYSASP